MKRKGLMVLAALLVVFTALAIYASRQISATPGERARGLPGDDLQRFKTLGAHSDEDFAAVPRIAHTLDELSLLQTIENVRDRTGCEAGHAGKPAGSYRPMWVRKDEVNALGVRRVQADALGDGLMEKDRLRAYLPAEIPEPVEQFTSVVFLGIRP